MRAIGAFQNALRLADRPGSSCEVASTNSTIATPIRGGTRWRLVPS
jgi:hypothetical protein